MSGHCQSSLQHEDVDCGQRTSLQGAVQNDSLHCDVMKKHDFEVLGCTEASGVVMTLRKS